VGRSSAYASLELRLKLFDVNSYIIPGPFGLTGFYDAGRVWLPGENSRTWHNGYGFGFYFIPYNQFLITGSVGFAEKERSLNFSIGSKFNLTY
jgi:outer membrane protein assembly factor BamA